MADEYIRINNNIIAIVNLGKLLNKNNLNIKKSDLQNLLALSDDQIELVIIGSSIFENVDDFKTKINAEISQIDYYISLWSLSTEQKSYNFIIE